MSVFRKLLLGATLLLPLVLSGCGHVPSGQAVTLTAVQTPFPLGVYAGNPDGNNPVANASFETRFSSFAGLMGATPLFMDGFVDHSLDPSQWPSNAGWTAWSWTQSKVVGTTVTPVIGIPMADNAHWYPANDGFFKSIVAGSYDADYQGVLDAWVNAGFKTLYLRLGYEMDGAFMPWYFGDDAATQADWVAAFKHLATLFRAEAAKHAARVSIVWNPNDMGWTNQPVLAAYPGDAFVDVISADAYSPLYPSTLYDWQLNNWSYAPNIQTWWLKAANTNHYWNYPSSNPWHPTGTGTGWGMTDTINLAKQHHKPIAMSETGSGGDGSSTGPLDSGFFPAWLGKRLTAAQSAGVPVLYVNIWDTWMNDGNWSFSEPSDNKPLTAAAWRAAFGAK